MALWVNIQGFANQELLEESVLNRPVRQLRERTDYLYSRLNDALGAGTSQSLRWVDAPLSTDALLAPVAYDMVFLNPVTRVFEKAVASVASLYNLWATADLSAYSLGMLLNKSTDGTKGTVVMSGRVELPDDLDLSTLLESGDSFRGGPYFLSSVTPGKLSSAPNGLSVYSGYLLDSETAGQGGVFLLNPQYRDAADAHVHRSFPLTNINTQTFIDNEQYIKQPLSAAETSEHDGGNGASVLTDATAAWVVSNLVGCTVYNVTQGINAVITANTANTLTAPGISWDTSDVYSVGPRQGLFLCGAYRGPYVNYTVKITDSAGNAPSSGTGFSDVYLEWTSTDPDEGAGRSRVFSYHVPAAIGTRGLQGVLLNSTDSLTLVDETVAASRRTYTVTTPDELRTWVPVFHRGSFTGTVATEGNFSVVLYGGPTPSSSPTEESLRVWSGKIVSIDYVGVPHDGDTLDLYGNVFEFDSNNSVTTGNRLVQIAAGDADGSYQNLLDALVDAGFNDVVPVLHQTAGRLLLGVPATVTPAVAITNATDTVLYAGGAQDVSAGATVLVYDERTHIALIPVTSVWSTALYTPQQLMNDNYLMVVPFNLATGAAMTSPLLADGDVFGLEFLNAVPGAQLRYWLEAYEDLAAFFPPAPLSAVELVDRGHIYVNEDLYPGYGDYRVTTDGIYWIQRWGGSYPLQRVVLHIGRMRIGTTGLVTSLRGREDSGVRVVRCGTEDAATTGDLEVIVDLSLLRDDANLAGYQVVKDLKNNRLVRGPVVSKILPGPGYRVLSPPGVPEGYGEVTLALDSAGASTGEFETVSLENAKYERIGMFPYIRLLPNDGSSSAIPTGFIAKLSVSPELTGAYRLIVMFTVFSEKANGGNAGLGFSYNMLRDYQPDGDFQGTLTGNLIEPPTEIQMDVALPAAAYEPILVTTDPTLVTDLPRVQVMASGPYPNVNDLKGGVVTADLSQLTIRGGTQVAIRIRRVTAASDDNSDNAGILNLRWKLVPA